MTAGAFAHPVHATFAEAVWNPSTNAIELALRVRGLDLEDALSVGRESRVDLDKTEGVDALIADYLAAKVKLVGSDGKEIVVKFADKEVGITNTWLYFEFALPQGATPTGCKLTNTVFFDELEGQKNVVEYREGRKKCILSFEGGKRELEIAALD